MGAVQRDSSTRAPGSRVIGNEGAQLHGGGPDPYRRGDSLKAIAQAIGNVLHTGGFHGGFCGVEALRHDPLYAGGQASSPVSCLTERHTGGLADAQLQPNMADQFLDLLPSSGQVIRILPRFVMYLRCLLDDEIDC